MSEFYRGPPNDRRGEHLALLLATPCGALVSKITRPTSPTFINSAWRSLLLFDRVHICIERKL